MARIFEGSGGTGDHQDDNVLRISAEGQDRVEVPGSEFIADSDMTRDGQDLVLSAPDGSSVVIEGYFAGDTSPLIAGPHGAALSPELVNSFLSSSPQYAQAATMTDESPVGAIEEIKGQATVTHADGTTDTLTIGSPIYQGDVVQTNGEGAVNIVFVDETSMAVSENARLSIDEYTFDPATESGTTDFSVLRGVFVFTSGLIGRDDPDDVSIDTPVGSIGIRGTIIAGNINPLGESEITVVEGAIVVKNGVSERTLSVQFETVKLTGFENDMQHMGVMDAQSVGNAFGAVSDVAPSLFSAINDSVGEESGANANAQDGDAADDAGEGEPAPDQGTDSDDGANNDMPQDMQMNDGSNVFTDNAFKEAMAEPKPLNLQLQETTLQQPLAGPAGPMPMGPAPKPPATTTDESRTLVNNNNNTGGTTAATPPHVTELNGASSEPGTAKISDNIGNGIGFSVSAAGDINGDGYADVLFSNSTNQNHTYVLYGSAAGVTSGPLTGLVDGSIFGIDDGFGGAGELGVIANSDPFGSSTHQETVVSSIGDFDGDGYVDYIIGQQSGDTSTNMGSGAAFIVSGADPTQYIALDYASSLAYMGVSVSSLGDINNDGYNDVIIGAPGAGANSEGEAYIVYGGSVSFGTTLDVSVPLTGSGETLYGVNPSDFYGRTVAGIGDFDGDGYDDYVVGASKFDNSINTDAGRIFVYSGNGGGEIMHVDGYNSSILLGLFGLGTGHQLGTEVFALGDINGDGKSDVMFAGNNVGNEAYILFGGAATNLNVNNMGSSGYKINVPLGTEILGGGAAGDFNGDGFDDFAIAVENGADANIYVVYGSPGNGLSGVDREFTLADLNTPGFAYKMSYTGGAGYDFSISSAGDMDGDGFDDLIIGIEDADGGNGEVIIVDGRKGGNVDYVMDGSANDGNGLANNVAATANNQSVIGTGSQNIYDGGFTSVSLQGGNANNNITIMNSNFLDIDGGFGTEDTLRYGATNGSLNLTGVNAEKITQIENLQFASTGQTITLSIENIFNMLKSSDNGELHITYGAGVTDGLLRIDAMTATGTASSSTIVSALNEMTGGGVAMYNSTDSAGPSTVFDIGGYTLYIDDNVMANTQVI